MSIPQLILPAGDLEKLKTACLFGADGVYMGGQNFSLRAYAGNFSAEDMATGISYLHANHKKAMVTVNILAHNEDLKTLPTYLEYLDSLKADALIISDLGVMRLALKYAPHLPITVSTQANISNYEAAAFLADLGAKRLVLARELTLEEIETIKNRLDIEIEVFVHGAMCMAYSGRCLLSHYMTGRNANQGACAHPCRYNYRLLEEKRPGHYFPVEEDERGSYILSSRDLCLLNYLPELTAIGVDAFKIEGRMKSPLYVASAASVYRQALDCLAQENGPAFGGKLPFWMEELYKSASRPFTSGFINGEPLLLQDLDNEIYVARTAFCGMVIGYDYGNRQLIVKQRANFGIGDHLELLLPGGVVHSFQLEQLFDEIQKPLDRARHPLQTVKIPWPFPIMEYSILRRITADE